MKLLPCIVSLVIISCKPIARNQHVLSEDSKERKVTVKFNKETSSLVACAVSQCHNLLLEKTRKEEVTYKFIDLDEVLSNIEKNKKRRNLIRRASTVAGVVLMAGAATLGIRRLPEIMENARWIEDVKSKMLKISRHKLMEDRIMEDRIMKEKLVEELIDIKGFPNEDLVGMFGKKNAPIVTEAIDQAVKEDGNVMSAISKLENLVGYEGKLSYEKIKQLYIVTIGISALVPTAVLGEFVMEIYQDKKLREQSENISLLFNERKAIDITLDELKRLLMIFSKYLPAKVDKDGLKELSAGIA